jgi:hypothetical protein
MRGKIIAVLAAAIVFTAFIAGCDRDEPGVNNAQPANANMGNANMANANMASPAASPGAAVSLGTITGNLNNYLGKTVTVEADVQEVFGPRAFTLDEDDVLAGGIDNDVLVVGAQTGNLERVEDNWMRNKVRVTGTVRGVALVELEREIGWDLDRQIEAELEDVKAVIVASSLQRLQ